MFIDILDPQSADYKLSRLNVNYYTDNDADNAGGYGGGLGAGQNGDDGYGGGTGADMGGYGGFGGLGIGNPGSYGGGYSVGAPGFGGGYSGGYGTGFHGGVSSLGIGLPESYGGQTVGGLGFNEYGGLSPSDFGLSTGGVVGGILGLFGVNPFDKFSPTTQNALGAVNNSQVAGINQSMSNPSMAESFAEKINSYVSNALGKGLYGAFAGPSSVATGILAPAAAGIATKGVMEALYDRAKFDTAMRGTLEAAGRSPADYGYMDMMDITGPTGDGGGTQSPITAAPSALGAAQGYGGGIGISGDMTGNDDGMNNMGIIPFKRYQVPVQNALLGYRR